MIEGPCGLVSAIGNFWSSAICCFSLSTRSIRFRSAQICSGVFGDADFRDRYQSTSSSIKRSCSATDVSGCTTMFPWQNQERESLNNQTKLRLNASYGATHAAAQPMVRRRTDAVVAAINSLQSSYRSADQVAVVRTANTCKPAASTSPKSRRLLPDSARGTTTDQRLLSRAQATD